MALTARALGKAGLAVALSLVAIAAAPLVMGPTYTELQPRTGALTVVLVEVLYALFIDFPLTALYVGVLTLWQGPRRHPARTALAFAGTFFTLILLCIALSPLNDVLAYWALADTFPSAVSALRSALGTGSTALLAVGFLAFDLLLCAAGGIVADAVVSHRGTSAQTHPPVPGAKPE